MFERHRKLAADTTFVTDLSLSRAVLTTHDIRFLRWVTHNNGGLDKPLILIKRQLPGQYLQKRGFTTSVSTDRAQAIPNLHGYLRPARGRRTAKGQMTISKM